MSTTFSATHADSTTHAESATRDDAICLSTLKAAIREANTAKKLVSAIQIGPMADVVIGKQLHKVGSLVEQMERDRRVLHNILSPAAANANTLRECAIESSNAMDALDLLDKSADNVIREATKAIEMLEMQAL
jgi:hypothetical protein